MHTEQIKYLIKSNLQLVGALESIMAHGVTHAVGCSHVTLTCTCHRKKAMDAIEFATCANEFNPKRPDPTVNWSSEDHGPEGC